MKLIDAEKLIQRIKKEVPNRAKRGFLKKAFDDVLDDVVTIIDSMPDEKRMNARKKAGATDGRECDVE